MTVLQPTASLTFRQAQAQDAIALGHLILESGQQEFAFLLQGTTTERIHFLQKQICKPHGIFSWKRHWVALSGKKIVAVLALQQSNLLIWDDLLFSIAVIAYYGWKKGAGILHRGMQLQRELPHPAKQQILIAHCATLRTWRSQGVFSALFDYVRNQPEAGMHTQTLVLDVLDSNHRAAQLYKKLGFTRDLPLKKDSRRVPTALFSTRLIFTGNAFQ